MRAHVFQHVPFEGPDIIGTWLEDRGAAISFTRFYEKGASLPERPDAIDLLVMMGGPMSVNDEEHLPWLAAEKRFVRETIGAGTAVLGVCLGAQLIASALGASVYPNGEKEIGWHQVHGVQTGVQTDDLFRFPAETLVFQWHGETFDLPTGATLLASSYACRNQAFQLGDRVIGVQFHLESTPERVSILVEKGHSELVPGPFVRSKAEILTAPASNYRQANLLMGDVLAHLTAALDAG